MPLQATSGAASYDAFGGGAAAVPQYIEDVFSTYLYTGNGSTQTITNGIDLTGKGGLTWVKKRSAAEDHFLVDSARGANYLSTNTTTAQGSQSVLSLGSSGFNLLLGNSLVNASGATYASWTFRKQPKFFDVVTYTGNGALATRYISHSLGSVPGTIIVKRTDTTSDWIVIHRGTTFPLILNSTAAATSTNRNNGYPDLTYTDATQFAVSDGASGVSAVNASGGTYVAYLFAHNAGGFGLTGTDNVISCGIVNGASAPTVNLGYEPQFVMFKAANTTGNWLVYDNMRGWTANNGSGAGNVQQLLPNTSGAETATTSFYTTSTGFAFGGSTVGFDYIYIAIRRGPMKVPTSGTSVFYPYTATVSSGTTITNGFPIDLQIGAFRTLAGENRYWRDRLRGYPKSASSGTGSPELESNSTVAENQSATVFSYNWNNTGAISGDYPSTGGPYSQVQWLFGRAPSFFDEVCYTGTGSNFTQAHNLGVAPELVIIKNRSTAGSGWSVPNQITSSGYQVGGLNTSGAFGSRTYPGSEFTAQPTASSLFFGTAGSVNSSGATFVAYLFATCAGVSKVGSYTGNGSSQTINCGFTSGARFVLIKATSAAGQWRVYDTARGIVAGNEPELFLNLTDAEQTVYDAIDTDSSGFIVNSNGANVNDSGVTYIFLAIA